MWIWQCKEKSINISLVRAKILSISLAPYLHAKSPTQSDENRPSTVIARKSDSYLSAIKERGFASFEHQMQTVSRLRALPGPELYYQLKMHGHSFSIFLEKCSKAVHILPILSKRKICDSSNHISLSNTFYSKLSISKFVIPSAVNFQARTLLICEQK